MRGDGGVAGEGRVAGIPKFHSCGISTPCHYRISTQIGCPTLPLVCVLFNYTRGMQCIVGEREGVVWCIIVFHSTTFSHLHTSHITIVSFPGLPHLQL